MLVCLFVCLLLLLFLLLLLLLFWEVGGLKILHFDRVSWF